MASRKTAHLVPAPPPPPPAPEKKAPGRNLSIQIGILNVPIKLHAGARAERISFRRLHGECLTALKQQSMTCPSCEVDVAADEMVKGFEFRKNEFVIISDEELDAQRPETSTIIEITTFVEAGKVDPIYFEASNYITPGEGEAKPYLLIRDALRKSGKVGIGRATFGQSEHTILIRPYGSGLALHTLFYESELKTMHFPVDQITVAPQEMALGLQLIENMTGDFQPSTYSDTYAANVRALVAAKISGDAPKIVPRKAAPAQPDLLAALTASLAATSKKRKVA